jgi:hypothetical protein
MQYVQLHSTAAGYLRQAMPQNKNSQVRADGCLYAYYFGDLSRILICHKYYFSLALLISNSYLFNSQYYQMLSGMMHVRFNFVAH